MEGGKERKVGVEKKRDRSVSEREKRAMEHERERETNDYISSVHLTEIIRLVLVPARDVFYLNLSFRRGRFNDPGGSKDDSELSSNDGLPLLLAKNICLLTHHSQSLILP